MIGLKIKNLQKSYNQPLLDEVSLDFSGDGIVGLIGDNGSGKSTLLKILAGVEEQNGGTYEWLGDVRLGYLNQEIVGLEGLSGGQKKIALLSDLFYSGDYNCLLLDEPDNHLDLDHKQWLMSAIQNFGGLVIIISHDRHLLRQITNQIWLVEDREVRTFPFGYEKFVTEYDKQRQDQEHLFGVQQKEHKRLSDLVEVFKARAASGPKAARYYHALQKRLERFEGEMIKDPKRLNVKIDLKTKTTSKQIKNKLSIMVRDLKFSYLDFKIFESADFYMEVGEKVGFASPNGSGKTTLIKLITGELDPDEGVARVGENLKYGYYSQDHIESLPENTTPLKLVTSKFPLTDYQAADLLKKFYFSKQTMNSKVWTLSGGQKARLQLALFLYTNPDVLILDEPTNHLDIRSVNALEEFLKEYQGAILLISHDQDLLDNVCDIQYQIANYQISLADK